MFRQSILFKILSIVVGISFIGFAIFIYMAISQEEKNLLEERRKTSDLMAQPLLHTIYKDMLDERADMARYLIEGMKSINGIERVQIIRSNGVEEAFQDFTTLIAVEQEYGKLKPEWITNHPNKEHNIATGTDNPKFKEALNLFTNDGKKDAIYYIEKSKDGKRLFTYLLPIEARQKCAGCHSSKEGTRGVLMISTSLEDMYAFLSENRMSWIIYGVLAVIGASILFAIFIKGITDRIRSISAAAISLSSGNYNISIPVKSRDEIGNLADSFNKMAVEINNSAKLVRESEERLRAIIDNSPAVIYLKDTEGRYILVNRRWEELFRYKREEMVGKIDYDVFPEVIAEVFRTNDIKVIEVKAPIIFDESAPHIDGLHHYISIKFPLFDSSGSLIAVGSISTDITERRLVEERLKEAQRLAKLGNWNWDIVNNKLFCSDEVHRIFGLSPHEFELTYEGFLARVHPGDRTFVMTKINEALNNRKPYSIEHRLILSDGTEKIVHDEAVVTFNEAGKPVRMDGTVQDITERKRAEDAKFEIQRRYEELINNLSVGVYRRTVDGKFLEANAALVSMLEVSSKEELFKHNVADFYYDKDHIKEISNKLLKYGYIKNEEVEGITAKDRRFLATFSTVMREDKEGRVYFDGIIEDITEQRRLEEQVRHSQKLESIGQLAAGISHDFNNILTAIIGYSNLLTMKRKEDELTKNYANQILVLSEKAANLTHGLLAFSRKQIISPRPVDINEIIKRVEKILTRVIGETIELKTHLFDKALIVNADSIQIEQILINLATNARDAMPNGGSLSISTGQTEIDNKFINTHGYGDVGKYALLSVSDTGAGIDEEAKKKIFEPFYTTKEVGKGTGLGLSIAYGIIKQHNGYINVESEIGKGTTFSIYLPLTEESVDKETPTTTTTTIPIGGTETVLLSEDEAAVRTVTKSLLEEFGYKVIEAVNGEDAVTKFKENKDEIQLLVFDVIMPKKNGIEAYEEIKKMKNDIKILFLTGYAKDIIEAKGISEKDATFVSKPVSPNEFLKKLREIVGK